MLIPSSTRQTSHSDSPASLGTAAGGVLDAPFVNSSHASTHGDAARVVHALRSLIRIIGNKDFDTFVAGRASVQAISQEKLEIRTNDLRCLKILKLASFSPEFPPGISITTEPISQRSEPASSATYTPDQVVIDPDWNGVAYTHIKSLRENSSRLGRIALITAEPGMGITTLFRHTQRLFGFHQVFESLHHLKESVGDSRHRFDVPRSSRIVMVDNVNPAADSGSFCVANNRIGFTKDVHAVLQSLLAEGFTLILGAQRALRSTIQFARWSGAASVAVGCMSHIHLRAPSVGAYHKIIRLVAGISLSDAKRVMIAEYCFDHKLTPGTARGLALAAMLGTTVGTERTASRSEAPPLSRSSVFSSKSILSFVCELLETSPDILASSLRTPHTVLARELFVYLSYRHTVESFPELTKVLGRNNHSTLITCLRRTHFRIDQHTPLSPRAAMFLPAEVAGAGTYHELIEIAEARLFQMFGLRPANKKPRQQHTVDNLRLLGPLG